MVTRDSTRLLLVSNALTAVAAVALKWPIETLLWPYWIQSVIIGWYSRKRMLALTNFTTEGLTSNGRKVEATPAGARSTANFFALHYGFFHLGYFVFLAQKIDSISQWDWLVFAGLGVSFIVSHGTSYRQNIEADLRGKPNLGVLLFLPYLRVIPMHFTIIIGGAVASTSLTTLLLFIVLKTLADIGMHKAEHAMLQKGALPAVTGDESPRAD